MRKPSDGGFSLIEVMFALGILTVAVLGAAGVLSAGMQNLGSSPSDVIVTQKAAQAIEAVFAARDSHRLTWAQIRNIVGDSGSDHGVFVDGPQPLHVAGPDGLVNTGDDLSAIESVTLPGKDGVLGNHDDTVLTMTNFTREIAIRDVANEDGNLRSVTVTVTYQNGQTKRTYKLTTFISSYS